MVSKSGLSDKLYLYPGWELGGTWLQKPQAPVGIVLQTDPSWCCQVEHCPLASLVSGVVGESQKLMRKVSAKLGTQLARINTTVPSPPWDWQGLESCKWMGAVPRGLGEGFLFPQDQGHLGSVRLIKRYQEPGLQSRWQTQSQWFAILGEKESCFFPAEEDIAF